MLAWPFVLSTWMLVANPRSTLGLMPVPLNELGTPEEVRTRTHQRRLLLEMQAVQPLPPTQLLPRQANDPIFRH